MGRIWEEEGGKNDIEGEENEGEEIGIGNMGLVFTLFLFINLMITRPQDKQPGDSITGE